MLQQVRRRVARREGVAWDKRLEVTTDDIESLQGRSRIAVGMCGTTVFLCHTTAYVDVHSHVRRLMNAAKQEGQP